MQNINSNINIEKIVLNVFKEQFPGAPEEEVRDLIDDIGQTIMIESTAKMVDEVEKKEAEYVKKGGKNQDLANEIRNMLANDFSSDPNKKVDEDTKMVKRISEICLLPYINIDLEKIYKDVATDVVRDVLTD